MPSKEQKKRDKREQNELNRLAEHQNYMEELEWEKGTDIRGIQRKQQKNDKQYHLLLPSLKKNNETCEHENNS